MPFHKYVSYSRVVWRHFSFYLGKLIAERLSKMSCIDKTKNVCLQCELRIIFKLQCSSTKMCRRKDDFEMEKPGERKTGNCSYQTGVAFQKSHLQWELLNLCCDTSIKRKNATELLLFGDGKHDHLLSLIGQRRFFSLLLPNKKRYAPPSEHWNMHDDANYSSKCTPDAATQQQCCSKPDLIHSFQEISNTVVASPWRLWTVSHWCDESSVRCARFIRLRHSQWRCTRRLASPTDLRLWLGSVHLRISARILCCLPWKITKREHVISILTEQSQRK